MVGMHLKEVHHYKSLLQEHLSENPDISSYRKWLVRLHFLHESFADETKKIIQQGKESDPFWDSFENFDEDYEFIRKLKSEVWEAVWEENKKPRR